MKTDYDHLRGILPPSIRGSFPDELLDRAREIRLRLGQKICMNLPGGMEAIGHTATEEDLRFCVNAASRYSPWNAATMKQGYLTAPGGHRIGVCGLGTEQGFREIRSLNIRIAKDIHRIADSIPVQNSLLIIGPPGSGKTTLLRDLVRRISEKSPVSVVDERCEIFPDGYDIGRHTDVLSGFSKQVGIDMVLRSMGPGWIAVDEITEPGDCEALTQAGWCGVKLVATAHAATINDLLCRPVYRPLVQSKLFSQAVVLKPGRGYGLERICP